MGIYHNKPIVLDAAVTVPGPLASKASLSGFVLGANGLGIFELGAAYVCSSNRSTIGIYLMHIWKMSLRSSCM